VISASGRCLVGAVGRPSRFGRFWLLDLDDEQNVHVVRALFMDDQVTAARRFGNRNEIRVFDAITPSADEANGEPTERLPVHRLPNLFDGRHDLHLFETETRARRLMERLSGRRRSLALEKGSWKERAVRAVRWDPRVHDRLLARPLSPYFCHA